jgi:pSer/pThr/pTyr-binding forkhead associated (FHA) protein
MTDDDTPPSGTPDHGAKALASGGPGLALELADRLHGVGDRPFVIGRADSADLVVDHASVSRHHARIVRGKDGFEVLDLDSRNGTFVDGQRVRGSAPLFPGVVLKLGEVSLVVRSTRRTSKQQRTTRRDQPWSVESERAEDGSPIVRVLPFMAAVDEALSNGDAAHAEWLFVRHVARPVERAALRGTLSHDAAARTAVLALRIADTTSSDAWLDFVVRLYSEADRVMPLPVVNAMDDLSRKLGGLDRGAFRQYTARLVERASDLVPEERVALDRLLTLAGPPRRSTRAAG